MDENKKEVKDNSIINPKKIITKKPIIKPIITKPTTIKKTNLEIPKPEQKKEKPFKKTLQKNKPNQKIKYEYAGSGNLGEAIRNAIPKQFIPTKKTEFVFGGIFVLILIIALIQFPFESLLSGDTTVSVKIGVPWTFLELKMMKPGESPLILGNLIIDLILYLLLAYAVDITINFILNSPALKTKEKKKKIPVVFKDQKITTVSDTVTKKIFNKEEKLLNPPKPEKKEPEKTTEELTVPQTNLKPTR